MSHLNESVAINTTSESNPFSDSLIIWIYNENLFRTINLPSMVYLCIVSFLGIFGNSLIIYIYGFRFKRTIARFFILSLAVVDNLCCIAITMDIFDKRFTMYSGNFVVLCKITRFIDMFGSVSSSMLLLCIAMDRYYKVCKPFKVFSYQKAKKCLIISVTTGLLLSWPICLFKGPAKIETGVTNVVGNECGDDDDFKGSVLPTIYFGSMGVLNISAILLLAFMYIRIFREILQWRKRMIGESPSFTPVSMDSSTYKLRRVISWMNRSKKNRYSAKSEENPNEACKRDTNLNKPYLIPRKNFDENGTVVVQNGKNRIRREDSSISLNSDTQGRRLSSVSNGSTGISKRGFKRTKRVTTNTVLFSVVTVIYIISYLPTLLVETLNRIAYKEADLSHTTRSVLVLLNVTYFLNNVCNQYVYSAIDPAFRKEVKQLFTGP